MNGGHELERVNWDKVNHYSMLASLALSASNNLSDESERRQLANLAVRYLSLALQQIEHHLSGRVRVTLWGTIAQAGLAGSLVTRLLALRDLVS